MSTGPRNKRRGYELEAELVKSAEAHGLPARRAWGSNGKAMGMEADVDVDVAGKRVQAKRRKRLPAYLQIPASCDAVAFRQDRGPAMVLVTWEDWLRLIRDEA
jgi:hypothetical protein